MLATAAAGQTPARPDDPPRADLVTCNILLSHARSDSAVAQLQQQMRRLKFEPDAYTFGALLAHCSRAGRTREAERVWADMLRAGVPHSPPRWDALLTTYRTARDFEGLCGVLRRMREAGCRPSATAINVFLRSCAEHAEAARRSGEEVHAYVSAAEDVFAEIFEAEQDEGAQGAGAPASEARNPRVWTAMLIVYRRARRLASAHALAARWRQTGVPTPRPALAELAAIGDPGGGGSREQSAAGGGRPKAFDNPSNWAL
eukprot:TRINITY_DN21351_c0_g1_i2.p4 TRINITY_DN21351_c0_g1~~TRINITY_DN21351_c0_g1_i2.p4  ORF type:complete len:259 (+),score=63.20 TRINITY_DN21351_c0_g1_i2:800-1576(+)